MSPPVEGAVFFAAGSVLVFLGGVTRLLPWWRRENGVTRSMVALSAAILLLLAPSVLHYLFGWTVLSDVGFAAAVCLPRRGPVFATPLILPPPATAQGRCASFPSLRSVRARLAGGLRAA